MYIYIYIYIIGLETGRIHEFEPPRPPPHPVSGFPQVEESIAQHRNAVHGAIIYIYIYIYVLSK